MKCSPRLVKTIPSPLIRLGPHAVRQCDFSPGRNHIRTESLVTKAEGSEHGQLPRVGMMLHAKLYPLSEEYGKVLRLQFHRSAGYSEAIGKFQRAKRLRSFPLGTPGQLDPCEFAFCPHQTLLCLP